MQKRTVFALALTALTALALSGCSAGSSADDGKVRVVASTNVYGDIASTIAGDAVEVDTTELTLAQVIECVVTLVEEKRAGK